jgi:hypothetical protein
MPRKTATKGMTDEHKAALAEGRAQGRAIREYLAALEAHRPKRGRKRTPDSIKKRLERIDVELPEADPVQRVSLIQERMDLEAELETLDTGADLDALERAFVDYAREYSTRKGITYQAWRSVGVPPATLKAAGIARGAG